MTLPDRLIEHDTPVKQYDEAGLNAAHIVRTVMTALGREISADGIQGSAHESLRVLTS
jgi:1-deoxy-D-xylulose-5-phosphate synthase